jgi:hypothetical protein
MSVATQERGMVHGTGTAMRLILAASLGNALEFYEILVYGYFAVTISLPGSARRSCLGCLPVYGLCLLSLLIHDPNSVFGQT